MYVPTMLDRLTDRLRGRPTPPRPRFTDRLSSPVPSGRKVNKLIWSGGMRPPDPRRRTDIPTHTGEWVRADPGDIAVTWIGHATCLVQVGGRVILTDPVFARRIPGVRARLTPPGIAFADLPHIDAVVISHNHFDHLDASTVRRLHRDVPVIAPAGLARWFRRYRFRQVTELDWWSTTTVGGVDITFVPGHHWSKRTPFDTCRSLWGGYVVGAGDRSVFFAGDSAYGRCFAEIGARFPGIELAIMPVGAYQPRWFMKPLHMNPAEAVRATLDLGASRMMTMHWGTFMLSSEPLLAPVEGAREAWLTAGLPRADLWDLAIGETRTLARSLAE